MTDNQQNFESRYMSWLAEKVSPAQLSELYVTYKSIETECKKARIIKSSLFECMNLVSVRRIKATVEGSKLYRFFHKKESGKTDAAIRYMFQYIQEEEAASKRELDSASASVFEDPSIELSPDCEESQETISAVPQPVSKNNEEQK